MTFLKFSNGCAPLIVTPFRQIHGDIDTLGLRVGGFAYSCDVSDLPSEAHASLAHILFEFDHDWTGAEREYRRANKYRRQSALAPTK
jgi:phosphoribosyl 1,2-cyclic phosphodiesterase